MDSATIKKLLAEKYAQPSHVFFPEMRLGTGYGKEVEGRMDGFAVAMWGDIETVAFEIKVSRADFLNEIKKPSKRRQAMAFSNKFFFVAPEGLLKPEEIPMDCGLMEVSLNKISMLPTLTYKVHAPVRERIRPTWRFLASFARRAVEKAQ